MAKPTDRVRKGTYDRENRRCVRCGTSDGLSYQHRAGDGMGGDPHPPGWEDGVTACLVDNQGFDGNASLQDEALRLGWKVPRWVRKRGLSAEVPYFDRPTNRWYRLDTEAPIRHPVTIRVAARMMHNVYGPDGPTGRKTRDLVPSG